MARDQGRLRAEKPRRTSRLAVEILLDPMPFGTGSFTHDVAPAHAFNGINLFFRAPARRVQGPVHFEPGASENRASDSSFEKRTTGSKARDIVEAPERVR